MSPSEQSDSPTITIAENGPYLVTGGLPLIEQEIGLDETDNAWAWVDRDVYEVRERYALCRCGQSANKPFCDGSHNDGFDGSEVASREGFDAQASLLEGPTMDLRDAEPLCAFARFCDGHGTIWEAVGETDGEDARELVAHQASHCPSGRLVVSDKRASDGGAAEVEPSLDPSVVCVEDPQQNCSGPLYVRGGVPVVSSDGFEWERRNRVALCRCGASGNKPFCDGSHASVGFRARAD